jgi:hypothetical protein
MIPDPEKIPGIKNSRNSQKKDVYLIGARHFMMNRNSVSEYPETTPYRDRQTQISKGHERSILSSAD